MANLSRNFTGGKMNKVVDERLVPNGEYIDALNIRMGSTENSEIGVIENTKGNVKLSTVAYIDGTLISNDAVCIGALDDSANETVYWFIHDPSFPVGATGKLDLVVSYNMNTNILIYHLISIDDGGGINTTLNFNPKYLITGVNKVDDLLFFTDDYNEPRMINVRRNYNLPVANIDGFNNETILVIKKPPVESPTINPVSLSGQENFLEERFVCFAYRYRYEDGQYSATSQWSAPSFIPQEFGFDRDNFLNDGMLNDTNGSIITFNSGGPLVVGIDLLFKLTDSNTIKVIEKLDKANLGYADNTNYQYTFSNSKIFTILPDSEILRLYDNVPRLAKAQTIMGNRLMYGNYVEGYDMIDKFGQPVKLDYQAQLVSEEISNIQLADSLDIGSYTINGAYAVPDSIGKVTFGTGSPVTYPMKTGSIISITFTLEPVSGNMTPITPFEISFTYQINDSNLNSLADLVNTQDFKNAIGTISNIQPFSNACLVQTTFTDIFNCTAPQALTYSGNSSVYSAFESGITAPNEPISINEVGGVLYFQFPAIKYVDNISTPSQFQYVYFKINSIEASYQEGGAGKSLHSNRGYEVGIVYMDEYNRSTTALVSQTNTVYVDCENSINQNSIRVTIPVTQIAPSWAKRYKFVVKPDTEGYETIYSNIYYYDSPSGTSWVLLEGENMRKVEVGDRYIVKADSNGPMATCVYTTVLDKVVKPSGAVGSGSPDGVYMKLNPQGAFITVPAAGLTFIGSNWDGQDYVDQPRHPRTEIEVSLSTLSQINGYQIPSGSKIILSFRWRRQGTGGACEARNQDYYGTFIASTDYVTFKDWWDATIPPTLNSPSYNSYYNASTSSNSYNPALFGPSPYSGPLDLTTNYFQFEQDGSGFPFKLWITGTKACPQARQTRRRAFVYADITIVRGGSPLIFETLPRDANPDIFFENDLSFPINANGEHGGNIQNQDFALNQPAIVNTYFFNCYTFGNGAESYKIKDSLIGRVLTLGNRVTSVSAQDYKEADRYADITYSGIYNNESNVNKLNEFNLGLLNYKPLEDSFGPIYKMDGRETDVLVLQEDKISYVLSGKNLLSDAAAGGAITSVPEVLGTQIARVEKYGISFNPESYVQWGYDRFFTDTKRGAVIQLKGNSYSNDQIKVVSEEGMRTWFRDMFISSFNTQKLGGFDPYMNEYVLSSNDRELGSVNVCADCDIPVTFTLSGDESEVANYCVNLFQELGIVTISWNVISASSGPSDGFEVFVTYDGNTVSSGLTNTSGSISFNKDQLTVEKADISINMTGSFTFNFTVSCPVGEELTIVEVVLTNNSDSGQTTYSQYRYVNGSYTSPIQSRFVTFASGLNTPLVSWYNQITGTVGSGGFPPTGSTMRMYNNKITPLATFDFNTVQDKFKYHRSNTYYGNNSGDITTLITIASDATPIVDNTPVHYADFTVPSGGQYLYLIWDYRNAIQNALCYDTIETAVCCDCESCTVSECITVTITNASSTSNSTVTFFGGLCDGNSSINVELEPSEISTICVINTTPLYQVVSGNAIVETNACTCNESPCYYYIQIRSEGWDTSYPTTTTDFTGWTIDGLDFVTNYAVVISSYGANTTGINSLRLPYSTVFSNVTGKEVIAWFTSYGPPPSFIGTIQDSLGNTIDYSWSEPVCNWICADLFYGQLAGPNTNLIGNLAHYLVDGFSKSYIDVVDTFGSFIDVSNAGWITVLENFYRDLYGPQVVLTSTFNPVSGGYDLQLKNVPSDGTNIFYRFLSDTNPPFVFPSVTKAEWESAAPLPCPILSDVTLSYGYNELVSNRPVEANPNNPCGTTPPFWLYPTRQITGINVPVVFRVEFDVNLDYYQPPCWYLYYKIDTSPPTFNTALDPMSQGFTLIDPSTSLSNPQWNYLPPINPNEYLTWGIDGPGGAYPIIVCGSIYINNTLSPFNNFAPFIVRNMTPSSQGQVVSNVTAYIYYCN
jgi:hypothetical protein